MLKVRLEQINLTCAEDLPLFIADANRSEDDRIVACRIAGEFKCRDCVDALLSTIPQSSPQLSWEAGVAVGRIGSKTGTRRLIKLLNSGIQGRPQEAAAYALWCLQDARSAPALLRISRLLGAAARPIACEALGFFPATPAAVLSLKNALADADPEVRLGALCGTAGVRSRELTPDVKLRLEDTETVHGIVLKDFAAEVLDALQEGWSRSQ